MIKSEGVMSDVNYRKALPFSDVIWTVAAIVISRFLAHYVFPMHDDAFIIFRYAENLVHGYGFVYNPGEWVQGVTCPGFGMLLAGLNWIGLNLPKTVPILNIVIDVLTFVIVARFVLNRYPLFYTILFGFAFGIFPAFNYICGGGMEANLFVFISLSAILLFDYEKKLHAFAIASLAVYIRPEGTLLVAMFAMLLLIGREYRKLGVCIFVGLGFAIPYLLWMQQSYSVFLPQSFSAKLVHTGGSLIHVFQRLFFPYWVEVVLLPFAIIGGWQIAKTDRRIRLVLGWALIYAAAFLISRPNIFSWYTLPVQVVLSLCAVFGMVKFGSSMLPWWNRLEKTPGYGFSLISIAVWASGMLFYGQHPVKKQVFAPLIEFCLSPRFSQKTIVAYDIGLAGYYTHCKLYDMNGLVWKSDGYRISLHRTIDVYRPDYLFVTATRFNLNELQPYLTQGMYRPVVRFSSTDPTNLTPDHRTLPDRYITDYIVYERTAVSPDG